MWKYDFKVNWEYWLQNVDIDTVTKDCVTYFSKEWLIERLFRLEQWEEYENIITIIKK